MVMANSGRPQVAPTKLIAYLIQALCHTPAQFFSAKGETELCGGASPLWWVLL